MATDSINNNYTIQKGQTLWQLGKSLGIKDSELNVWCQKVANQNHITDPTKIKADQTITLEGLSVEKNSNSQQNESSNDTVPQNNAAEPIKSNETNNKQTEYIVQNGETPEAIVKKMYIASGNPVDVNSAEFKEAVADFIDVNKDQIKNFGGHKGFIVGSTVKLPGKYDTTKMDMKSKEEALSDYTIDQNVKKANAACAKARKESAEAQAKLKEATEKFEASKARAAAIKAKGDGHISWKEKLACTGKGLLKSITGLWTDENGHFSGKKLLKTVAVAAACTVAVVATGGAATPLLVAAGATMGAIQVTKGAINASKATTNDEARAAWTDIGEGSGTLLMSCAGARGSLRAAGMANEVKTAKNGISVIKSLKATGQCFTKTPKSIAASFKAIKNVPQVKANLTAAAKSVPQGISSAAKGTKNATVNGFKATKKFIVKTPEAMKATYTAIKNSPRKALKATTKFIKNTPEYAKTTYKAVKNAPKRVFNAIFKRKASAAGEAKPNVESNMDKTLYTQYDSELQYEANLKNKSTEAKTKTKTTNEPMYTQFDSEQAYEASLNAKTTKAQAKNTTTKTKQTKAETKANVTNDEPFYSMYDSEQTYEANLNAKASKAQTKNTSAKTKQTKAKVKTKADETANEPMYTQFDSEVIYEANLKNKTHKTQAKPNETNGEPMYTQFDSEQAYEAGLRNKEPEANAKSAKDETAPHTTVKTKFTKMTVISTLNVNHRMKTEYKQAG